MDEGSRQTYLQEDAAISLPFAQLFQGTVIAKQTRASRMTGKMILLSQTKTNFIMIRWINRGRRIERMPF